MKLYYHKTDGGAEYYSLTPVEGTDEGDANTAVMRTDGNEIVIFGETLKEHNIKLVADQKQAILYGVDMVRQLIARNRSEAERDGDDEWIEEREAGWQNVLNGIAEIKESLED